MSSKLLAALQSLGRPRVLVLGDIMLDRYTTGCAQRISPEAPVPVLAAIHSEDRLGGAASCAFLAAGLDADVSLMGVIGSDDPGAIVHKQLAEAGIAAAGVFPDSSRPTTLKERFIGAAGTGQGSQILRVDRESCAPLQAALAAQLLEELTRQLPHYDVLLVSDYGKGVCTPPLLQGAIRAAYSAGKIVLVDPARGVDFARYHGATLIKPNRLETELASGEKISSPEAALAAGRRICRQHDIAIALVTLDRDGMALTPVTGPGHVLQSKVRHVFDVTGAGDMVVAMLGVALAGGLDVETAAALANVAGGLEVERSGVSSISREDVQRELSAQLPPAVSKVLSMSAAAAAARRARQAGQRVVLTNGCFDLLHVGHVTYLAEAASLGDLLIVGINSDASVSRLKGPRRPVIRQQDRAAMLAALSCVDAVVVFDEDTPHHLLEMIRPDVLVKGGTYRLDQVVGHEVVTRYGGEVKVTSLVGGVSTTGIIESMTSELDLAIS